jgi:hypothetical protein
MPEDYRPTEPVNVFEEHVPASPPPPGSGRNNSLLWVAVVVAVFMAVPFLASWATRTPRTVAAPTPAASAPAPEQAVTERATPPLSSTPAPPDRPAPLPARPPADPTRQVVTKCVEGGRIVYTQTGHCAGSVSAVPIDANKNVVGPGADASRP